MIELNPVTGAQLLADDITAGLGYEVQVNSTQSDTTDPQSRSSISIRIPSLGVEMGFHPQQGASPESVACQLASHLQDDILSKTGMVWPTDPGGGDQPLVPGDTGWYRESDPTVSVPYGRAGAGHRPDDSLDGVVRWWLGYWFVGVIADKAGDVWFSEHEFEGDLTSIQPGTRVDFQVGSNSHGLFRKATRVSIHSIN
ncbi:hypothetical protein [Nocardia sp. SSK8]|uniref:hypothetical protein n=1 Tax=Nocardia sp. SSK8 TaxID=3120154 RepID=UPI00300AC032